MSAQITADVSNAAQPDHIHAEHPDHVDEIAAPLHVVLRERLIDVVTLRRDLRLIVGVAVAQMLAAALLLALKNASGGIFQPSVYAFPGDSGNGLQLISIAAFFIGVVLTTAAWALLLAGAFRAGVVIRLGGFGLFVGFFAIERDAMDGLGSNVHVAVYLLLAAIAVIGIVTWPAEHRRIVDDDTPTGVYGVLRALTPLALFVLVGAIYAAVFIASRAADNGQTFTSPDQTQVSTFTNDVFDQLDNVQYLLIPVLVLAGSDFGEWGQLVVARIARRVRRAFPTALFAVLAGLACGGIAYDGINVALGPDGGGLAELWFAAVVFAVAVLLYYVARPTTAGALLTATVLLVAIATRRLRQWMLPISALLIATVTIEVLSYIELLYASRGHLEQLGATGNLAIGGAILLIVALLWDLAVSGEAITNVPGRIFPRDMRVLDYLGYVLLVAASVLMFASLHDEKGKLLENTFDPEQWVQDGILFLGIPLVLTLCVAAFHRIRASGTPVESA